MPKIKDLTGQKFGRLTVIKMDENKYVRVQWICECDCGNIKSIRGNNLKTGKAKSCGCLRSETSSNKKLDLTGQKFGRLTAIKIDNKNKQGNYMWLCKCDCGNFTIIRATALLNGDTQSCGCLQKEVAKKSGENNMTHGMSTTSFYKIWKGIKNRCLNKNDASFKNWGGRGITICDRWLDFNNFKKDMYESYLIHVEKFSKSNTSIDRIDVNGNYCKDNCRWATWSQQANNRRPLPCFKEFKALSPDGVEYLSNNQSEFAREHSLDKHLINACLHKRQRTHQDWRFKYV